MDSSKKKNLPVGKNLGATPLRSGKQQESTSTQDTAAAGPRAPQTKYQTPAPRQTTATVARLKPPESLLPLPRTAVKSGPDMSANKYFGVVDSPRTPAKSNPGTQAKPGCVGSGARGICRPTSGVLPGKDRNPTVCQPKKQISVSVIGNCSTDTANPAAVPDPIDPAAPGVSQVGVGHIATETPSPSVSGVLAPTTLECAQLTEVQVADDVPQVGNSTEVASPVVQAVLQNPIPSSEKADCHVLDRSATLGANQAAGTSIQSLVNQALSDHKQRIERETKQQVERDCARAEYRKSVEEEVMKSGHYSGDQLSKKALQNATDAPSNEKRLETDPTKAPKKFWEYQYKSLFVQEKASKLASILARAPGRKL